MVEYDSIVRNSVWDVVPRPKNKSVRSSYWLYKVKQAVDGSVEKYKARVVAHGFSQVEGIDCDETFAPVVRSSFIKSMLALSTQMGWKIHQMDVKIAFLNGKIEEEVYIEQPEGFETLDHESHVCQIKRALYELKQAPRAWYTKIDNYFTGLGFTKSEVDANLYHIMVKGKKLIIVLYVDDLIFTVWQKVGELFVSQGKYANEILKRFHMEKCKPMQTPLEGNWRKEDATSRELVEDTMYRQLVGSLMQTEGVKLQSFTDADWARSPSDLKSTSGGIFNLGQLQFLGTIGNRGRLHLAQQMLNTWLQVRQHVRPSGCGKF
eukprot:PITA_01742